MINIQYCSCPTSLERLLLHLRNWRRRRRHFDFKFLRPRHILFRIFFPFLRHFNSNFIQIFPLNLARHFCGFNWYLYSFLTALSGLVVCKFFCPIADILDEASSSKTNSKWRQMTIVPCQIPVCVIINTVYTKLKCVFYGSNELILPFFKLRYFFYFFTCGLLGQFPKKVAFQASFCNFFLFACPWARKDPFELSLAINFSSVAER